MAEPTIEELKRELDFYRSDPEKRGYFALRRIVNMQIDHLNSFNIKANVTGKKSEDASFERTQSVWEKLPNMITSLNDLKSQLRISPDDEKENSLREQRLTPESISDVLSNT